MKEKETIFVDDGTLTEEEFFASEEEYQRQILASDLAEKEAQEE